MHPLISQRSYLAGCPLKCAQPSCGIHPSRCSSCVVVEAGLGDSMKKFMESVVILSLRYIQFAPSLFNLFFHRGAPAGPPSRDEAMFLVQHVNVLIKALKMHQGSHLDSSVSCPQAFENWAPRSSRTWRLGKGSAPRQDGDSPACPLYQSTDTTNSYNYDSLLPLRAHLTAE